MSRGNPDESGQRRRRAAHNAIVLPTAAALGESEVARNPRQGGEGVGHAPKDLFMHMLVHHSSLVCWLAASACAGYKCTDHWADDGCRPVAGGGRVRPNTSLRIKTKS